MRCPSDRQDYLGKPVWPLSKRVKTGCTTSVPCAKEYTPCTVAAIHCHAVAEGIAEATHLKLKDARGCACGTDHHRVRGGEEAGGGLRLDAGLPCAPGRTPRGMVARARKSGSATSGTSIAAAVVWRVTCVLWKQYYKPKNISIFFFGEVLYFSKRF